MRHFTDVQFDAQTGEIVGVIQSYGDWVVQSPGVLRLSDIDKAIRADTHYVDLSVMEVKPKGAMAAVERAATISGLPIPTTVEIGGVSYVIDDGVAELSFNLTGTYLVRCKATAYLTKDFVVTV